MGLDSYLYSVDKKDATSDFLCYETSRDEFKYWRKHHDLHKWMSRLFVKKGGDISFSGFNCEYVRVTLKDLKRLKDDLDWVEMSPEEYSSDIEFVNEAIDNSPKSRKIFLM